MKFIVDSLPYYGEDCPFREFCKEEDEYCPRYWDKYEVTSIKNPHECEMLREIRY